MNENMSVERQQFPQFFITEAAPCPYLPDRDERKVFTHLSGDGASALHDTLAHGGFRRSQNIAYRPSCPQCSACTSVRIPVDRFNWSRSFRRIVKRCRHLDSKMVPAKGTGEQYSLFSRYIADRHDDGGMADMGFGDYLSMVEFSTVETRLVEYRFRPKISAAGNTGKAGKLACVALTDVLGDGLSMVYSFFDPELQSLSPGSMMILDHVRLAQKMGLAYLYLGYWIDGSRKMAYKRRFRPLEMLGPEGWKTTLD